MALLGVVPIDRVDGAVGAVLEVDGEVFLVGRVEDVLAMAAGQVGGVAWSEDLAVELVTVERDSLAARCRIWCWAMRANHSLSWLR